MANRLIKRIRAVLAGTSVEETFDIYDEKAIHELNIANNLTTTSPGNVLDATQGRALDQKVGSTLYGTSEYVTGTFPAFGVVSGEGKIMRFFILTGKCFPVQGTINTSSRFEITDMDMRSSSNNNYVFGEAYDLTAGKAGKITAVNEGTHITVRVADTTEITDASGKTITNNSLAAGTVYLKYYADNVS